MEEDFNNENTLLSNTPLKPLRRSTKIIDNNSYIEEAKNDMQIEKIETLSFEKELENNKKHCSNEECVEIMKEVTKKKKFANVPLINCMISTIGMIGKKLNLDKLKENNYQYWDCVTKKDNWLINEFSNFESREKLVKYCKSSFLKAYPTSFNSDNYDCLKTWLLGSQISAINIQKLNDDNTLLNCIFFMQNKKSGYILKPNKLRNRKLEYSEKYKEPVKKISINLISGYLLNLMGIDKKSGKFKINLDKLKIIIKIKGTNNEDSQKHLEINLEDNLINPHFYDKKIEFDIYEPDLSCIFIYISDQNVIGRSILPLCMILEGIRSVPLFDENCEEFKDSKLILQIEMTDLIKKE